MDSNPVGTKRTHTNSPDMNSPRKTQKMDWNPNTPLSNSSPKKKSNVMSLSIATSSINNKMNNIAKLRQQFVEEIKDIEITLKESINNLKFKISETNKKANIITDKLREENKLLCNQSEIIYKKEQENKILREKVEELYEYQKIIFECMEDISNTLNIHENLSNQLMDEYNSIIIVQQNDHKILEEELKKITPDEKYLTELNEINLKINEKEKENLQDQNDINQLELQAEVFKIKKEEQHQTLQELDKKINELEAKNSISKQNAVQEKNNLLSEIEQLNHEINVQIVKITELNKTISDIKIKLEKHRNSEKEIEKEITEINSEVLSLIKENEELDEMYHKNDQQNAITLEKLKEQLKNSQNELASVKQKEIQATSVLQNKISEIRNKLMINEDIDSKLKKLATEIKKENESIAQITEEYEKKKKEYDDKIKFVDNKTSEIKTKINEVEQQISEFEDKIQLLEKEIHELNDNFESKRKSNEQSIKLNLSQNISAYNLPDLFASEDIANTEKQKNRKMLYTPTLADDDLEIDSLSLEEQFTRLTQSKSSSHSQSQSPDKTKKFFKHSNHSQSKIKKESTSRNKGKGKKY